MIDGPRCPLDDEDSGPPFGPPHKGIAMDQLMQLWMPIVVSAVVVWIASALAWMVLPHHRNDWKKAPNDDLLRQGIRAANLSPGVYFFPGCDGHGSHKDPEHQKKFAEGPVGLLTIFPPGNAMGGKLAASFVFYLIVGVFVAYITSLSVPHGAPYLKVFQVAGTAAVMAYAMGGIPHSIWFNRGRALFTDLFDGIMYGLLTAGVFGWLWPKAAAAAASLPASIPGAN